MAHEDLNRAEQVEGSSDRSFGFVFAVVFVLIGLFPLLKGGATRWWALGIAAVFAVVAVVKPSLLAGFNRQWTKLGILLGKVVSPVALGVMFYFVFTPVGLLMRLSGKDPLRLKREPDAASYWIRRQPPGPPPDSLTNQY
jgi:hypothetical protein